MRHPRRHTADERLDALLRDVSSLRLTLDTDLTVAAAAAEAARLDVAAEIVDFDRAELAAFAERATTHLFAPTEEVATTTSRREPAKPALRHRIALAAAPAMLAAAAVVAVVGITGTGRQAPASTSHSELMASYSALTQLARSNDDPARLVAVGHELNQSLAQLIAAAGNDPAKARQIMRILQAETVLLTQHHPNGSETLLAQARDLVRRLQQTVPSSVLDLGPAPGAAVSPPGVVPVVPSTAATQPANPAPTRSPAAANSPAPAPETQGPSPEPSSGDATVPPEPSPQPTLLDPWPFGDTHGDGG